MNGVAKNCEFSRSFLLSAFGFRLSAGCGRLRDKPLWGLKVLKFDGAIALRALKFDTAYGREGCSGRF